MEPSHIRRRLSNCSARTLSAIALLALVPATLYALGRSLFAVVAVVNVLLIFGSIYVLTSPVKDAHAEERKPAVESEESAA